MGCVRSLAVGLPAVWFFGCNSPPPIPDNPVPFAAPDLGVTKTLAAPPPPISGGTMLLSRDGKTAIASDPDRDFVSFVDISTATVRARAGLSPHDEPGRLVEDNGGQVHVALRGSGELATLSLASGQLVGRRPVCPQPRGVAYDATSDHVLVACATGEFVTLPAASGPAVSVVVIEPDLRDVVIDGDSIFVSKFRTAEILKMTRNGDITGRVSLPGTPFSAGAGLPSPGAPPGQPSGGPPSAQPSAGFIRGQSAGALAAMAWRMRLTSDHQLMVSYQLDSVAFVRTTPGGYGGGSGIVEPALASVGTADMTAARLPLALDGVVLPVDVAPPPAGVTGGVPPVLVAAANWKSRLTRPYVRPSSVGSLGAPAAVEGQIIAAEIGQDGTIFLQSREPARLYVVQAAASNQADALLSTITLSGESREDTGHTIFHTNSGGNLACASCHGEGGDDAQTWNFNGSKPRRTPSLLGTVKGTAPYHWDADFPDLQALSHEVYTRRMSGRLLAPDQVSALRDWLEPLPAPKRPAVDPAARARGEALFLGKATCSTCHSGSSFTNNATVDVGTGIPLQVPPLVGVGARGPFMHTGCAATLMERFTKCATSAHGTTSDLTPAEINDLVIFLSSI